MPGGAPAALAAALARGKEERAAGPATNVRSGGAPLATSEQAFEAPPTIAEMIPSEASRMTELMFERAEG